MHAQQSVCVCVFFRRETEGEYYRIMLQWANDYMLYTHTVNDMYKLNIKHTRSIVEIHM